MQIIMFSVALLIGAFAIKWYVIDKVSILRLSVAMLLVMSIGFYVVSMENEVLQLRSDTAAQQEIIDELKAESVDKQDEIETLEALLKKNFNDAAPPRGNSDIYYDIKLSKELQFYTYQCCKYFGIDYKLFLSLMYVESSYNIDANNRGKYIGLTQVSVDNVDYIEKVLGVDIDIYNPYDNILAGTFWLSRYVAKYPDDVCMQLQCYNMGETGAKNNRNNTTYYNKIISYYLNI